MKKLLRRIINQVDLVNVHMKDGKIYSNLKVEELGSTAFQVIDKDHLIRLIKYDEVQQINQSKQEK